MLTFDYNDQEVKVQFQHGVANINDTNVHVTSCDILLNKERIVSGSSVCSPFDQFNRREGRKYALLRATELTRHIDEELRIKVLENYFRKQSD